MTDVRAILESESRFRERRKKFHAVLAVVCVLVFPLVAFWNHDHHKPFVDGLRMFFPILFLGSAGAYYTSRHLGALKEAIADPDPKLDAHFAEMLISESEAVAKIGREAFLERFSERLPQLDDEGWENVGWSLKNASTDEAEALLHLLAQGAPAVAIERIEDFRRETKVERLKTGAHAALGEIRLRVARDRVLSAAGTVRDGQEHELQRLHL